MTAPDNALPPTDLIELSKGLFDALADVTRASAMLEVAGPDTCYAMGRAYGALLEATSLVNRDIRAWTGYHKQ